MILYVHLEIDERRRETQICRTRKKQPERKSSVDEVASSQCARQEEQTA